MDVPIGPFLDATDAVTAETGLTITQPDIRLKKNGGAWAQKNAAQTLSHEENGYYEVTLDATDTDTLGLLRLAVAESGALPIWEDFMVMPANVWDSLFGADKLQVHADEITNGLITAAAIATGAIDADAIAADAVTEIQSGLSTFDHTTDEVSVAAASKTGYRLSATGVDDILDEVVEGAITQRQMLRGIASSTMGKLAGAATDTITTRDMGDTKDRLTVTTDADGNRTAVTRDLT